MKRIRVLSLLLAASMLLGLCACGNAPAEPETVTYTASIAEVGAAPETTPIPAIANAGAIAIATPSAARSMDANLQAIYDTNDLEAILQKHNRVTVTVTGYDASNAVNYYRVLEISNLDGGGTYVRVHHESAIGTAEMEGTSALGYIACEWNDGRLEAACSLPGEFLDLAQEVYLDSPYMAAYSNVTTEVQGSQKTVLANMTYVGDAYAYDETFVVDNASNELISMTERTHGETGSARTEYSFAYDTPYNFPACSVLGKAITGNDLVSLTLVYRVPEYNYTTTQVYRVSKAFTAVVDSKGYYMISSDPNMSPDTRIDSITLSGDATYYVNITSYQADVEAVMRAGGTSQGSPAAAATPIPAAPSATPAPQATPVQQTVYVVKNPTDETVYVGGKALFVAYADFCTKTTWELVSPDGSTTIQAADAPNYFGTVNVYGLGEDTLTLANIPKSMNGWRVQCRFDGYNGPAITTKAYLTVLDKPKPTPTPAPKPTYVPAHPTGVREVVQATEGVGNAGYACRYVQYSGWYTFYCECYNNENLEIYVLNSYFPDSERYISQAYSPSLYMYAVSESGLWLEAGQVVYVYCSANEFTGDNPSPATYVMWYLD